MEAFFLPTESGARFCIHHPPIGAANLGIAVVFAPAFAEEMNKARHVVAQTARRLSDLGIGVLLVDPLGCGDSDGNLEDATWAAWHADVHSGASWLAEHGYRRFWVWGMRLGALLAAESVAVSPTVFERCILWQPVSSGEAHLIQFLRLRTASAVLSDSKAGESVKQLRAQLREGAQLEVAGYCLTSRLAMDIDSRRLDEITPACPVSWFEVVADESDQPSASSNRVLQAWQDKGVRIQVVGVEGESFWSAVSAAELIQCPSLVEATAQAAHDWV